MRIPFDRQLDEIFRSERSIRLKAGAGVLVALYLVSSAFMWLGDEENRRFWRVTLVSLLFAAGCGGVIGLLLTMKIE
jgi:hypothetical protein